MRSRPYVALDSLDLAGRARRGVRLPRSKRRGQDDDAEAAHAAHLLDERPCGHPRPRRWVTSTCDAVSVTSRESRSSTTTSPPKNCSRTLPRCLGTVGAERQARVARLLDEVGLGAERRMQLRKYSKGMIQRVGLAQALLNDPEVVFFDEPMSGLDPLGRRAVRDLILRLRDRGTTVFLQLAHPVGRRVDRAAASRIVAAGQAGRCGNPGRDGAVPDQGMGCRHRRSAGIGGRCAGEIGGTAR